MTDNKNSQELQRQMFRSLAQQKSPPPILPPQVVFFNSSGEPVFLAGDVLEELPQLDRVLESPRELN